MTWAVSVNGTDLATLGFYLAESEGIFDAVNRDWPQIPVYGRAGVLFGSPAREGTRQITFSGNVTTTAKTVAARVAAEDQLKDQLRAGLIRIVRSDGFTTDREIDGYAKRISIKQIGHPLDSSDSLLTCTIETVDAYWRHLQPTLRAVAAAGTRYTVPLGTAPSTPIIQVMGTANTPVITYRDSGGAVVFTTTVGINLANDDWANLDMRTGKVTKYVAGVASNASGTISGDFPWSFDPQDGNYSLSFWPTIEVSLGTALVMWWKAWQ